MRRGAAGSSVTWPGSSCAPAVNRSMGKDDLYPFVLAPAVIAKLGFVHTTLAAGRVGIGAP